MKRLILISFILALSLTLKTNADPVLRDGGYGYFYNSLAPYGTWIQLNDGVTVWRPVHMPIGWAPYKYGSWVWTNDGWYWNSDEPFGYIVFHYGRWYYDDYYGWIWVPDDVWAPAWVEWRYDNDYIGWAPLPPYASFSIGFGIRFSTGYTTPYSYWHFVKYRYMCNRYAYNHYVHDRYKYRIYGRTKYRTNYGYSDGRVINRGVDVDFVKKRSGSRIVERNIERVNNAGELRNTNDRNSGSVRAVIIPKDQLNRSRDRNIEIRTGNRRSSLEMNKIQVGRTGTIRETERNRNSNPGMKRDEQRFNDRLRNQQIEERNKQIEKRNKQIEKRNQQNNRNENPNIRKRDNNRPQKEKNIDRQRNENRRIERQTRPQVKREAPQRRAPESRRQSGNNRNERRSSNNGRGR